MYVDTPEYCFAINPKTGCTSILSLIYSKYYDNTIDIAFDNANHYILRSRFYTVPFKPVILIIRDPIDRFLSAMDQVGLDDVESCLDSLTSHKKIMYQGKMRRVSEDAHFRHQYSLIFGQTHLFRFLDHYDDILRLLNIESPMVHLNKAKGLKPTLSSSQRLAIINHYAEDMELYDSIKTPNTIIYS